MKRSWSKGVLVISLALAACGGGAQSGSGANSPDDGESSESGSGSGSEQGTGESSGESASGEKSGITIAAPEKGQKALESRNVEMQFDLTLLRDGSPAGMQGGSWSVYEERTLEVLATGEKSIDKLGLAYGRREAKALLGVEKPSVTAGKTYVVESGGSVKLAGGKDAPEKERAAVLAEYGWVGQPSPLLTMLADLSVGGSAKPPADARRALVGEVPGIDHEQSDLSVTLTGIEGSGRKRAKLDLELTSELDGGDVDFTLDLAGPAVVDVRTGWVESLSLSGKLSAKGTVTHKKKPMEAKGKGSAKIERKAEFR